jgi:MFS transporter, SP family, sugar:H+ symporter
MDIPDSRPSLMFGAIGMSVSQLIVASVGTALPDNKTANQALIAFVCIYIFFFACSWGPCGKNGIVLRSISADPI